MHLGRRKGIMAFDFLMIPVAWLGVFWLQSGLSPTSAGLPDYALRLLPIIIVIQGVVFQIFGLHQYLWRFVSTPELIRVVQAVAVGSLACALCASLLSGVDFAGMNSISYTSFVIFGLLLAVLLSGPRVLRRWFNERRFGKAGTKRVLIVGAGRGGAMLVGMMLRDPSRRYHPVGIVDDDPDKAGGDVGGVPILGHCGAIPGITAQIRVHTIVIAVPSMTAPRMRRIVELCERSGVPMRITPHLKELASGRASLGELRPVVLEDLLEREPMYFDWPEIRGELTGRSIVVTGAGGSIGSELCRQIAELEPSRLILLDNSEFNLYRMDQLLSRMYPTLAFSIVLADICDAAAVGRVFERYRPEAVFHAAAYKHVPMLEDQMREALRVNVLGTQTTVDVATKYGAGLFVLLSSDKAVNPTNVMGASKRLAETVCHAAATSSTRFITVRFGNVLESTGSVVPLFRSQIAHGGPVTVTAPEMQRYFMTISEACHLIMASATLGKGGEIFVFDMGEPIPITYLADQMIYLSGKVPGRDVGVEFIGLRPGEKLSEELFRPSEEPCPTRHGKIFRADGQVEQFRIEEKLARLREACDVFDEPAMRRILFELVPEYYRAPSAEEIPRIATASP